MDTFIWPLRPLLRQRSLVCQRRGALYTQRGYGSLRFHWAIVKYSVGFFRIKIKGEGGKNRASHRTNGHLKLKRGNVREGGLRAYHTNSRSLGNEMDLIKGKVCVETFDIAVTVIWIALIVRNFYQNLKCLGIRWFVKTEREEEDGGVVQFFRL